MNVSRAFLVIGGLYLLVGIAIGMVMGAKGDFTLAPLHAHINLLGFVLMTLFGVMYHVFPAMSDSVLSKVHFWMHQIGALILLVMLGRLLTGQITEADMPPLAPIAEGIVWLGVLVFVVNVWMNARSRALA
jgi:cbb3-type cytochrome oxidase subunit 1